MSEDKQTVRIPVTDKRQRKTIANLSLRMFS